MRSKTLSIFVFSLFGYELCHAQDTPTIDFEQSFLMGGAEKTIKVDQFRREGIQTVIISPKGFNNDEIRRHEIDSPISEVFVTDLNNNGKLEYFLIPLPAGSGGYVYLIGYEENQKGILQEITLQEPQKDSNFKKGYRGKDSYSFEEDRMIHTFPVYDFSDPNCCPSNGKRHVEYLLENYDGTPTLVASRFYGN